MAIAYDLDNEDLFVEFKNGSWYQYLSVDAETVVEVLFSESQGEAFTRLIKNGHFPFTKVDNPERLSVHV